MKFTNYFMDRRKAPDRVPIKDRWIAHVVDNPLKTEIQSNGRIRKWAWVPEQEKYLRVVLLPDGETVHNAFFDRRFKEE